jgi:hypothetical protein
MLIGIFLRVILHFVISGAAKIFIFEMYTSTTPPKRDSDYILCELRIFGIIKIRVINLRQKHQVEQCSWRPDTWEAAPLSTASPHSQPPPSSLVPSFGSKLSAKQRITPEYILVPTLISSNLVWFPGANNVLPILKVWIRWPYEIDFAKKATAGIRIARGPSPHSTNAPPETMTRVPGTAVRGAGTAVVFPHGWSSA